MSNDRIEVMNAEEEPLINYRGVKAMAFILGNETFEKLGAMALISNLLIYLTTVFNMNHISAATLINVFHGTTNFATLVGAILSDKYFGRYKTLAFSSIASFLGLSVITLTAVFKKLHPPHCESKDISICIGPTGWQMAFLLSGFGLLIIGAGGIRPCNLAFGADQFNPKTQSGKITSFFNWYFFTLAFAQMVSVTLVIYVQSNISWSIGLAIPSIFMLVSCFLFFGGTKIYVKVKPEGGPLISLAQVLAVSIKKRRLDLPAESLFNYTPLNSINSKLPHTHQLRFLDKAAIVTAEDQMKSDGSTANPWKLCSMQQVEEAKCVVRVIPIWTAMIVYHIAIMQQQQYVVFQALQSERSFGNFKFQIPAASYMVASMLTEAFWIAIYDRVVVPLLRRITGKPGSITLLQRMGFGIFLTVVASLTSAFVEERRKRLVPTSRGGDLVSAMSAFWLVPQISLAGLAEAFCVAGQSQFYYNQFPENMRSIGGCFLFLGMAASGYLNSFLISIVHHTTGKANWLAQDLNKGRLDYFYFLITALGILNLVYFIICARWYKYKGTGDTNNVTLGMDC